MTQITESGHARNVANFDDLISFVQGYGESYNPSRESLKVISLQELSRRSKDVVSAVNAAIPAYSKAVAAREAAFAPLSKLATRVINSLKAVSTTDHIHENALTYVRKIQGRRAVKRSIAQIEADIAAGNEVIEKSASQMSYDNRLDNFDKLIKLLSSVEQYAPNEADLKIASLASLYADLIKKNAEVISTSTPLSNSRIARDVILYNESSGLVDIAMDVKAYVKSVYGATSPQYKQLSGLKFKKR